MGKLGTLRRRRTHEPMALKRACTPSSGMVVFGGIVGRCCSQLLEETWPLRHLMDKAHGYHPQGSACRQPCPGSLLHKSRGGEDGHS